MRSAFFWVVPVGLFLAAWVVVGRGLFGLLGDFTGLYVGILGVPMTALHILIARGMRRTAGQGFVTRPRTFLTLGVAWLLFLLLGFTIPDRVDGSVHSVLTGDTPGVVGMAIGISNPLGIIGTALLVACVICTVFDARGPHQSEDDLLDAQNRG